MGVDRYRVCELYASGPVEASSGSGYRLGDRLGLTARHVIAPALAEPGGQLLGRPVGVTGWLPARGGWQDAAAPAPPMGVGGDHRPAPGGGAGVRLGGR